MLVPQGLLSFNTCKMDGLQQDAVQRPSWPCGGISVIMMEGGSHLLACSQAGTGQDSPQ